MGDVDDRLLAPEDGHDPDFNMSQIELEQEMVRLARQCERIIPFIAQRGRDVAIAKKAFNDAYNRAYTKTQGTQGDKKAAAGLETSDLAFELDIAKAALQSAKDAGHNYRTQLDTYRSVNSNMRAQVTGG